MNITKSGNRLETSVYRKSTNTGLLLHYHRYVDKRYKDCLLTTMNHRAFQLSSTPTPFSDECNKLRSTFLNLDYPINLINSAINKFLRNIDTIDAAKNTTDDSPTIMVPLPFKDQQSANSVKKQMQILSANIVVQIKPVFQTKKIGQILALKEKKPPIVNNQCKVYKFECDLCDADYVGYTARHLHQRIKEHKHSVMQFFVLTKCRSKFDCLIFEMLFIKELNPPVKYSERLYLRQTLYVTFHAIILLSLHIFTFYSCLLGIL